MALQGKIDEAVTFWGICCSSWVHVNSGTSKRDYLTPMGCGSFPSVQTANLLVARLGCSKQDKNKDRNVEEIRCLFHREGSSYSSRIASHAMSLSHRSILLILLCICMGGKPVIENPGSSLIWMHERFQWLLGVLQNMGIRATQRLFSFLNIFMVHVFLRGL